MLIENILNKNFNKKFFLIFFREGNLVNTIEIKTSQDIPIDFNILKPNNIVKEGNVYIFTFISIDRQKIEKTYEYFKNHKIVKSINVNLI